jgi:hypothetical protein
MNTTFDNPQLPPIPFKPGDRVYTDDDYPRKITRTVQKITRVLYREPDAWVPTYDIHLDGGTACTCCGHRPSSKTISLAKYCHLAGWDGS